MNLQEDEHRKQRGLGLPSAESQIQTIILTDPKGVFEAVSCVYVCVYISIPVCVCQKRQSKKEADWWSGRGLSADLSGVTLFSSGCACVTGCRPRPRCFFLDQMSETTSCIKPFNHFLCLSTVDSSDRLVHQRSLTHMTLCEQECMYVGSVS